MESAIDTLLQAARLAPSGDNTQPWDFAVSRDDRRIDILANSARDPSPMNAGDRMLRIAIGTALENMVQVAEANGWEYSIDVGEKSVRFCLNEAYQATEIDPAIADRASNRRRYEGRELSSGLSEELQEMVAAEGSAAAAWVIEPADRQHLCDLISEADSLMLSNETIRKAFLAKVRFDLPVTAEADEGLSLGSLELSGADRFGMRMMRWLPDFVLQLGGIKGTLRSTALRLATSASGFCVVTCSDDAVRCDFDVGRVFQRSWLALTRQGLAVQPMMSLLVLRNIGDNGSAELNQQLGVDQIGELLAKFSSVGGIGSDGTPSAMLRFGYADLPSTRVGRMSLERLVQEK